MVRQKEVLKDRQVGTERQLLERGTDSVVMGAARTAESDGIAKHADLPRIWLSQAVQELDEGRFAGAVLPQKGMDGTAADIKRHGIQSQRGSVGFPELCDLKSGALPEGIAAHLAQFSFLHRRRNGPAPVPTACE
jgi:hypothetical protein